ncbi:phosphatase PAP2 family protein [Odoribacter sp. OttesenSCG-928-L07]|nr:phosphatase PAP2 family protein [Odoribacter sp. OttesenSCG-928-L07]MDL2239696.1 phosphatase PAP2 family protein [Bacteroidales bacterium OttesenSCG-928-L14]MDL2240813.1 phosphatase PAP2 family protein [Bacteroidales bacterium OttesenSCG-928-K22]
MWQYLENIDKEVFLFLNGIHNNFFDVFFEIVTTTITWIPLFALLIYLIIRKYKKKSIVILLGVVVLIALTDIISAQVFKPCFARLRPCHDESLAGLVHTVNNKCGGMYSFVSSHAANLFGIATYSFLALRKYYKHTWLLFLWATLIGYSRIYLGVHFPGDVICGTILGVLLATGVWKLAGFVLKVSKERCGKIE